MSYNLGLTGFPVAHSLSPRLHQAALASCGLAGEYRCYPVPADDAAEGLGDLLQQMRAGELHGLNVTIPHKQTLIPLLDFIAPSASGVGAVNTVVLQGKRLVGENTDVPGFQRDLQRLGFHQPQPGRQMALVMGAGGAARAVVQALIGQGWGVRILARRPEKASELAVRFASPGNDVHALPDEPGSYRQPYGLVVNTTPLGMPPYENSSPWPADIPLPATAAIYDLVYQTHTPLIQHAEAAGLPCAGGLGMLVEQAALAFELWTGHYVRRSAMWQAVKEPEQNRNQRKRKQL